ncbi:MAG: ShlB/FhaC/HecB family hemolysin secretion/activation protein [Alphaproteobacteria bacterium]|nr:ShlB/FhaC/HecB family hemolysin secretion/activation protein [Alphaproteobacteria bacterium]MDE2341678.1 ShlB/FhaC/HecB family hemolysin secretion/activation protein [Alphaproteobacteria bacterium]
MSALGDIANVRGAACRPASSLIGLVLAGFAAPVFAQPAAPITVTPQTLAPEHRDNGFRVEIPETGALHPPVGAENLSVTLGDVQVAGGFAEVADQTAAIVAHLKGQRVSLKDIYAAASEIEAIHARAGFVLARVSVPSQDLHDGGPLRIVVTDGFIEAVDVSGLPRRVREPVRARVGSLQGKRHLTLKQIEEPLMIASDVPGLTLRSTLMRGSQPGGTRLVLEGTQQLVTGSIGADNQLDPSLGTYGANAQVAFNSLLGLGEQIYGFASGGYDVSQWLGNTAPVQVFGGGMILPFAQGRFSFNPEATYSRTVPAPVSGAPQTVGLLRRLTMRGSYTLIRTRQQQGGLSLTVEQIDEKNAVPAFATFISHDRYMVARLGGSYADARPDGTSLGGSFQFSEGLGNLGALSVADATANGIPFSRVGSSLNFSKLMAQARLSLTMGKAANLSVNVRGQSSFGAAVFRSEQFALEGPDGLSAYVGGVTAVDEGAVARGELGTNWALGKRGANMAPYVFVAGGVGRINVPTALEPNSITAGSAGVGARINLGKLPLGFTIEYAHGFADYAPLNKTDRVNVSTIFRF